MMEYSLEIKYRRRLLNKISIFFNVPFDDKIPCGVIFRYKGCN